MTCNFASITCDLASTTVILRLPPVTLRLPPVPLHLPPVALHLPPVTLCLPHVTLRVPPSPYSLAARCPWLRPQVSLTKPVGPQHALCERKAELAFGVSEFGCFQSLCHCGCCHTSGVLQLLPCLLRLNGRQL